MSLLYNHDSFITKLQQKKLNYLDEGWFFIAIFKIESVSGMRNKGALVLLIKLCDELNRYLPIKIRKFVNLYVSKKEGELKLKYF